MEKLFSPNSVAIIGASADEKKVGGRVLKYLKEYGYEGHIYPINPKYNKIDNYKCYPNLESIPEQVDLTIISLPKKMVLTSLQDCGKNKVKAVIIFTAGFAETGKEEDIKIQQQIQEYANQNNINICGPNTFGLVNVEKKLMATFTMLLEDREIFKPSKDAKVGFVSQSGGFGAYICVAAAEKGIKFNYYVGCGNQINVNFGDYIHYILDDEKVAAVAGFLEGVSDASSFLEAVDKAQEKGKPLVILKAGNTEAGAIAAQSHTAAITGSNETYHAIFKEKNIIRANTVEELIDYLNVLTHPDFQLKSKRIGVLSMSGGAGAMIADQCIENDLTFSKLHSDTEKKLQEVLPGFASLKNPVDLGGGQFANYPEIIRKSLNILCKDPNVDILVAYLLMGRGEEGKRIAEKLVQAAEEMDKPLMIIWAGGSPENLNLIREKGLCLFENMNSALKSLSVAIHYHIRKEEKEKERVLLDKVEYSPSPKAKESSLKIIKNALDSRRTLLTEYEGKQLLKSFGIQTPEEVLVTTKEETIQAAEKIGLPVVLKVSTSDIAHKSEAGIIALNLQSIEDVKRQYDSILKKAREHSHNIHVEGVLVQEMVKEEGIEVILGAKKDPIFGMVMLFGLGGLFVEIFKDVSLRLGPLGEKEAERMIKETKAYAILKGARRKEPYDMESLVKTFTRFSLMVSHLEESIQEMDINPLKVFTKGNGVKALDVLVKLKGN